MIYTLVFVLALLTVLTFFVFSGYLYRMLPEDGGLVSLILQVRPLIRWIVRLFSPVPLLHGALCGAAEPETDLSQSAAGRCGLRSVLVCLLLFLCPSM